MLVFVPRASGKFVEWPFLILRRERPNDGQRLSSSVARFLNVLTVIQPTVICTPRPQNSINTLESTTCNSISIYGRFSNDGTREENSIRREQQPFGHF